VERGLEFGRGSDGWLGELPCEERALARGGGSQAGSGGQWLGERESVTGGADVSASGRGGLVPIRDFTGMGRGPNPRPGRMASPRPFPIFFILFQFFF
jgi:hypothetical protein